MRDVNLTSSIIKLKLPEGTDRIQILYDERGWAIRCYDSRGHKITTLIRRPRFVGGSVGGDFIELVPREEV